MTTDQYESEAAGFLVIQAQHLASTYNDPDDEDAATIALLMAALERLTTRQALAHMIGN